MKKIFIIVISLLLPIMLFGQYGELKYSVANNGDSIILDRSGYKATVKRMSVFGERIIEGRNGEKITIKKNAVGHITIESKDGLKVTLKENMMGGRTITDSYGKDAVIVINEIGDVRITDSKKGEMFIPSGLYGNMQEIENFAFFEESLSKDFDYANDRREEDIYRAIRQNRNGELEYSDRRQKAVLKKDKFEKVIYEDSNGNELKFSKDTWRRMMRNERNEKRIFASFINMYL